MQTAEEDKLHRLTNVEAQRIMAVIEDTVVNVHLLAMIGSYAQRADELAELIGPEIVDVLHNHEALEERYEDVWERARAQRRRRSAAGDSELEAELKDVRASLEMSTRNVCRMLRQHPDAVRQFRTHFAPNRTPGLVTFIKTANELRDLTLVRLQTTVEEAKSRQDKLSAIISRERQSTAEMEKLQGLLNKAMDVKEQEELKRDRTIHRLTKTLEDLANNTMDDMNAMEKDANNKEASDLAHFARAESELQAQIAEAEGRLAALVEANKSSEQEMRKNRLRVESEVVNWLNRYDEEMGDKQDQLEELEGVLQNEQTRLQKLERRYNVLKREYDAIMEEHQRVQAQKEANAREFEMMIRAATKIAAVWRGHVARKAFRVIWKRHKKRSRRRRGRRGRGRSGGASPVRRTTGGGRQRPAAGRGGAGGGTGGGAAAADAPTQRAQQALLAATPAVGLRTAATPGGRGVSVVIAAAGSPAAAAGLKTGDVIYRVGATDVTGDTFDGVLRRCFPGEPKVCVVERDGGIIEVTLRIGAEGMSSADLDAHTAQVGEAWMRSHHSQV